MRAIDVPPIWTLVFLVCNWALDQFVPVYAFDGPLGRTAGWVVALAGLAVFAGAVIWFRRKRTTIHPGGKPTALIVEGPYRFSRNPIYLAMATVILGQALWLGSILPVLMVYAFVRIITVRFILREERNLHAAFGAEADKYFASTRRWL